MPRQRPHKLRPIPISQFPIIPLSLFCQCQKRPAGIRRALLVYRNKNTSFSICQSLSPWERCHCKAMTERASPARQSHCTAIGRLFVRAKRSPHPCLSVSILALSGAPRQIPLFVASRHLPPAGGSLSSKGEPLAGNYTLFSAASTTWLTSTEVVTVPTPPGTGVMASTTGSASPKRTSPQSLPSSLTWMPTSTTT